MIPRIVSDCRNFKRLASLRGVGVDSLDRWTGRSPAVARNGSNLIIFLALPMWHPLHTAGPFRWIVS